MEKLTDNISYSNINIDYIWQSIENFIEKELLSTIKIYFFEEILINLIFSIK